MFRLKIGLLIGGALLAFFGARDLWLNMFASSEPVQVDLAALEAGQQLTDNNVKIGRHVAAFPDLVYEAREKSGGGGGDLDVNYTIYPIVSLSKEDQKRENGVKPDFAPLKTPRVLVKSYKYRKESELPSEAVTRDSMQGMVINSVESLDNEAKQLINQAYPGVNFDQVVIVEEGRKPTIIKGALMLLGGVVLVGAGAAAFVLIKS